MYLTFSGESLSIGIGIQYFFLLQKYIVLQYVFKYIEYQ